MLARGCGIESCGARVVFMPGIEMRGVRGGAIETDARGALGLGVLFDDELLLTRFGRKDRGVEAKSFSCCVVIVSRRRCASGKVAPP